MNSKNPFVEPIGANHQRLAKLTVLLLAAALTTTSRAAVFSYSTMLDGASEARPNDSPGTGLALVDYDDVAHTLRLQISFSGLVGTTRSCNIHATTTVPWTGTIGVATTVPTLPDFPAGVTSGTYSNTLDLTLASSYSAAFLAANGGTTAGAEAALAAALAVGRAYVNIHTTSYPLGEIRGFPVPLSTGPPRIEKIQLSDADQVTLSFYTEAQRTYTLEYTDTLVPSGFFTDAWLPLFVAPSLVSPAHYIVPDTRTNRHRFYRLQVTP